MVMRHRPKEAALRRILPWLASDRKNIYNAYQQAQGPKVEKALQGASFLASFIGHTAGKAIFVGLYKVNGYQSLSYSAYWELAENIELAKYGVKGMTPDAKATLWFDLELLPNYSQWSGKLVVNWPGRELSWWRWAKRNEFRIEAIHAESFLVEKVPNWRDLHLTWQELMLIPERWKIAIQHWRAIYLIIDKSDGKGYVGGTYGTDHLLGRWRDYAKTGDGGNVELKKRDPQNFEFCILERITEDTDDKEVQILEANWKRRLQTVKFGLNC
ncbi:hypothetical protein A6X21_00980 [Planctopirus hydrillae]|uniref:GIY-YIG domain-containing protein n=2 Tax=Planctopirus hydrillae TaxID=1841610 RepID=A0A1C3E4Y4_9PLAN|nr:hypothetical protein A6X21_00980 [Planctopirus hydrillae]